MVLVSSLPRERFWPAWELMAPGGFSFSAIINHRRLDLQALFSLRRQQHDGTRDD